MHKRPIKALHSTVCWRVCHTGLEIQLLVMTQPNQKMSHISLHYPVSDLKRATQLNMNADKAATRRAAKIVVIASTSGAASRSAQRSASRPPPTSYQPSQTIPSQGSASQTVGTQGGGGSRPRKRKQCTVRTKLGVRRKQGSVGGKNIMTLPSFGNGNVVYTTSNSVKEPQRTSGNASVGGGQTKDKCNAVMNLANFCDYEVQYLK